MITDENSPTVVIDIDNTIIDTAIRKKSLLREHFKLDVAIEDIRNDFHLVNSLGKNTVLSSKFFTLLEDANEIAHNPAPTICGASETIQWLKANGFHVIFLTARPEACRDVTIKELKKENIDCCTEYLIMKNDDKQKSFSSESAYEFKKEMYKSLSDKYKIIIGIGDRPEDALAAQFVKIPAILLKTTATDTDLKQLDNYITTGVEVVNSWPEIVASIEQIRSGISQMEKLRELFISQYAKWLFDVDEKIKTIVSISAILSTIAGHQLLQTKVFKFEHTFLLITFFLSVISVLYCIRGMTSRRTSGYYASTELKGHIKQLVAIMFGRPKNWLYRKGDAIDNYYHVRLLTPKEQASAHLSFFHDEYGTFNPQALLNLRMLELRSASYSKAYAERIASKLLMIGIVSLLLWILTYTFEQIIPNVFYSTLKF